MTPDPLQLGHTFGLVPGRAPLPWQFVQGAGLVSRNGIATPLVASMNHSSVSVSRSLPRRGRLGRGGAPRPNSPPNRSPMFAPPVCPAASNRSFRLNSAPSELNPPKLSPLKRPRPNPPPGFVVFLALSRIRQHAVRLGHRLESLGGTRLGVGVGMKIAGQLPVGPLDLVGAGVRGDAELLVEVLFDPFALGHTASPPYPFSSSSYDS